MTGPRPIPQSVKPLLVARVLGPFQEFARIGSLGGMVLLLTTVVALLWSNSPYADSYFHLWEMKLTVGSVESPLTLPLHAWINDALMMVFFLLVGLEIKREILVGELSSPRQAALPIFAALGGMVIPALLYTSVNWGGEGMAGWGVPMATDIAFALGILALLGKRVPLGLKVFLAALAIVDDLGAVLVIAIFYTSDIDWTALAFAGLCLVTLIMFNRAKVRALTAYLLVGVVLWYFFLRSGIHATIAGVLLAMTIPTRTRINAKEFSQSARNLLEKFENSEIGEEKVITSKGRQEALHGMDLALDAVNAPLLKLEHGLHSLVGFGIMPVFALANAGVRLEGASAVIGNPVAQGIALGLLLGKFIGILLFSWLAVRLGMATLPSGVHWRLISGAACLGGIGFTMSLFIAGLAFGESPMLDAAKIGILAASCIAGALGYIIIRTDTEPPSEASG
ncbi:MAG: Na+/H+ antiporter NhaA [Gemmatimonadaceae bacterium]